MSVALPLVSLQGRGEEGHHCRRARSSAPSDDDRLRVAHPRGAQQDQEPQYAPRDSIRLSAAVTWTNAACSKYGDKSICRPLTHVAGGYSAPSTFGGGLATTTASGLFGQPPVASQPPSRACPLCSFWDGTAVTYGAFSSVLFSNASKSLWR